MEGGFEKKTVSQETEDNIEVLSDWRELKEQAPDQAESLIAAIEGYEDMSLSEKMKALETLQEELSVDNKNRFIAIEIAHDEALLEEEIRHKARLEQLGVAA